jgi:hypothetical protein
MVNIKYLLNAESFAVLLFYLIELNNALAVLELEQNEVLRANSQIEALKPCDARTRSCLSQVCFFNSRKKVTYHCSFQATLKLATDRIGDLEAKLNSLTLTSCSCTIGKCAR